MTGSVTGIRRRRTVAGRRETSHLPPDRDFYGQTLIKERWFYIIVGISDDNDLIYRAAGLVALVDPGYIWRINDGSANVARGVEKIRSLLSSVDEVSVTGMSKMLKAFDLESNVWTLINQAFKDGKIKE